MKLTTYYMENLSSPNFKTRQFGRTIEKEIPDGMSKEDFLKEADKQQKVVELLVKEDVRRHIEELNKQG